jgi:hypothetical protein
MGAHMYKRTQTYLQAHDLVVSWRIRQASRRVAMNLREQVLARRLI